MVYNLVISGINVYCFAGFLYGMVRAESFFDKRHDPLLQKIYYLYWLTKVRGIGAGVQGGYGIRGSTHSSFFCLQTFTRDFKVN